MGRDSGRGAYGRTRQAGFHGAKLLRVRASRGARDPARAGGRIATVRRLPTTGRAPWRGSGAGVRGSALSRLDKGARRRVLTVTAKMRVPYQETGARGAKAIRALIVGITETSPS